MVNLILLLWALVGLIGGVHGKCSLTAIADNERSIAYACIHSDLRDLDVVSSETEWIEFSVSRFHAIPDDAFRNFPNLRRLSFYNCHINVIEPAAFRGLQRLDWLIFHGTRIHAVRSAWFHYVPNLRRLVLDRCGLVHVEPNVFRMLPRLETLDLRDNDLDCLSVEELSHLTALRTVRIDGNPWLCECRIRMERFFRERSIVQEVECRFRPRICTVQHRIPSQCMAQIDIPLPPPTITVEPIGHPYIEDGVTVVVVAAAAAVVVARATLACPASLRASLFPFDDSFRIPTTLVRGLTSRPTKIAHDMWTTRRRQ